MGCGKMGSALTQGALEAGVFSRADLRVYDRNEGRFECLGEGVQGLNSLDDVLLGSDILLLCVKPDGVLDVLARIAELEITREKLLVISVAAGVTIARMEEAAKGHARVIRTMPNTPSLVGEGAAAFSLGSTATASDAEFTRKLLGAVGEVIEVKESLIDAVTGLSGSGPAYVYTFIEALADGALLEGLPREHALKLATQTVLGAAKLVAESGEHPAVLRDRVTSPGGTTICGLAALEEGAFRSSTIKAVRASAARARELGA